MNPLAVCMSYMLILIFSDTQVAAQEGPGIVIGHPGQDVELLCTVIRLNDDEVVAWLVNHGGPYGVSAIRNGIWAGYSANGNNLLVESIMMNDIRNRSDHRCVITTTGTTTILRQSDPTILYVAGVPGRVPGIRLGDVNVNGDVVTFILSWEEPFNYLDPIVNYTVSCSGDVTCPPSFTTTDNTTRSYTITDMVPMTTYIFSVVATNSIGSGEAGREMITTPSAGSISTSSAAATTTIATTSTTTITEPSSIANSCAMNPNSTMCLVTDDETDGNGAVVAVVIVVVIVVLLILGCCIVMDILFCYCCKRKERCDQDNEEDKHYNIVYYATIAIAISTCGTSVLLWWLYRRLVKCFSSKDKYDIEAHSEVPMSAMKTKSSKKNGVKEKKISKGPMKCITEDTSTNDVTPYATNDNGDTPTIPSYAVTDVASVKNKKKDKKAGVKYMDPSNLEFGKAPENHAHKPKADHTVQYGNFVETPLYS